VTNKTSHGVAITSVAKVIVPTKYDLKIFGHKDPKSYTQNKPFYLCVF
jgi:hypothetical protein